VAAAGPQFQEGSVQIFHHGRDLVLGAQVFITDEARSLSFEEKLVEPVTFKSSRLEGLWWLPGPRGKVLLAVSNVMNAQTSATITVHGERPTRNTQTLISLAPHETRVLDVQRDLTGHEQGAIAQFGGISITHSGINGAVIARGFALDADAGYSLAVQFSEPAAAKSLKLQGAGLRVGQAGGSRLSPVFITRNVGDATTTVTGRLPFTAANGSVSNIALPELRLAPGEMSVVDASQAVRAAGLTGDTDYTGVEFEYTGTPGSVTITALSVGQDGNQVFRVPLWDIDAQRSSTGGYPWSDDGHSSTTVYIKNTAEHAQRYFLELGYPGGVYSIGVKTIEGGQTMSYDLRKLRDEQVPGAHGEMIPLDTNAGQIHWSKVGTEAGVIIGRVERADTVLGVSSNYACANCCNDNPTDARVTPSSADGVVGGSQTFIATQRLGDCYDGGSAPMEVDDATWQSSDEGVASVSVGMATGQAPGTVTITAHWWATSYTYRFGGIEFGDYGELGGSGYCEMGSTEMSATATYKVYQITIKQDGTDITNTSHDVIVGQQINLVAEVKPAGTTISSQQWTIPGNPIANYAVNFTCETCATSGTVTQLSSLNSSSETFYWYTGGDNRQVQYSATINGQQYSATATFNVKRPTAQVLATTPGSVAADQADGFWALHFGVPGLGNAHGINFSIQSLTIPTGFSGTTEWVQLVTNSTRTAQLNTGPQQTLQGSGLDTLYPYDTGNSTDDSPAQGLDCDHYSAYTVNDQFTMWLMFKPSTTGAIYVPLRKVDWS